MPILPHHHLMIDANINRFKEGARVLEDLARFVLKDYDLFTKIKKIKHQVKYDAKERPLSKEDVGGLSFKEIPRSTNLIDIANANALRMQEAARVLEETYEKELYKSLRFASYDIHTEILNKLSVFLKKDKLHGIYAICDPQLMSIQSIIFEINQKNISICQLRMKNASKRQVINALLQLRNAFQEKVLIIVNDHLDIALALADGVHLGQEDFPIEMARTLAPSDFIIGVSCHSLEEALLAEKQGATYIAVGCLYPSTTKKDAVPVSLDILKEVVSKTKVPVCAIGGINSSNIDEVKNTNVAMIAMSCTLS